MVPFNGLFLDKDGIKRDMADLPPPGGGKIDPLIDESVLDGIFGDGVFDAAQVTITLFGQTDAYSGNYAGGTGIANGRGVTVPSSGRMLGNIDANNVTLTRYGITQFPAAMNFRGSVYVGDGKIVAIPYNQSQPFLINTKNNNVAFFGPEDTRSGKYNGGVYIGDGKVLAIPNNGQHAIIDTKTMTITPFGDTFPSSRLFGGVYVGNGKAVAIPSNLSQPVLIDTKRKTTTSFGATDNNTGKYYGGVYVGSGRVLAIPFSKNQAALIDTKSMTITRFGASDATTAKYIGGVYIGGGKAIAIPSNASQPAMIDTEAMTITKFGEPDTATGKYFGGIYAGNGKVVAISAGSNQSALIDLGESFRPAQPLSEAALLSAWFNKL